MRLTVRRISAFMPDGRKDDILSDYEQKKQARIDRNRERANKARAQSDALAKQSIDMIRVIPPGQPIMSATDARYRERAGNKMRQSFAASDKAAYYDAKAKAAENNTAIFSDDPEAIAKLTEKLERLKAMQEFMKAVNAFYRKHGTCHGMEGLSEKQAEKLDQNVKNCPIRVNVPFASFSLSNNNKEIHRIQDRLKQLTEAKELGYTGWTFEGGRVEASMEKNRLQIFFDAIPDEETRRELKSWGFRWARSEGAWQRQLTDNAIYAASRIKAIRPTDGTDPAKIQPKRNKQPGQSR